MVVCGGIGMCLPTAMFQPGVSERTMALIPALVRMVESLTPVDSTVISWAISQLVHVGGAARTRQRRHGRRSPGTLRQGLVPARIVSQ